MKQVLHNLKNNRWNVSIGLLITVIGVILLSTPNYFFWPPNLANLMNDDGLDVFIIMVGLLLIECCLHDSKSSKFESLLLGFSAAIIALITFIELIHFWFAGMFRNALTIALAIFALAVVFLVAADKKTGK